MRKPFLLAILALLFPACSHYEQFGLRQGASSTNDVQRAMGAPGMELRNADGTRQLAYPRGPMGTETIMVYLTREGVLDRIEQVLTDDRFNLIRTGTTSEEVRALIGPPWRTVRFENLQQDAWDYRYRDTWGYLVDFSVMIDDRGRVASKASVRIESGRDGGDKS